MKTLSELWKEFDEKGLTLTPEGLSDLQWHIENDDDPLDAIGAARDMIIETVDRQLLQQELVPVIAKLLDHKDSLVRAKSLGSVVGIFETPEYGKQALVLARFDPDTYVRVIGLSSLGVIINKVDPKLARKIAMHLYTVLTSPDEKEFDFEDRLASKHSVLDSMGIHYPEWGTVNLEDVWKSFLKKYNLKEKEFVRIERGQ